MGKKILKAGLIVITAFVFLYLVSLRKPVSELVAGFIDISQEEHQMATLDYGWELILVNSEYYIPENYQIPVLTELSNGEKVDSRIYPELQRMFDDARATGLDLYVASGYRTEEKQQQLMEDRIRIYRLQGNTKKKAVELAQQWVAKPGTSEHQIGIAVDINANIALCTDEEVYGWLEEHAHEYGFIKRYPSDKVHITGIAHEPWHYRYVGAEAAEEIYRMGVCLEEYIDSFKK